MRNRTLGRLWLLILVPLAAPGPARPRPISQAPETASQPARPSSPEKPEKKVWTNENLPSLRGDVSVVGSTPKNSPANRTGPTKQYIQQTRKQLEKMKEELADIDKQMAALKKFSEGEGSGEADRELHKRYNSQPVSQQLQALETKRKETLSRIDALLDEARKKGVEPGELR